MAAKRLRRSARKLATRGRPALGHESRHPQRRPLQSPTLLHTRQAGEILPQNRKWKQTSVPPVLRQRRQPSPPPQQHQQPRIPEIRPSRSRQHRRHALPRPRPDPPNLRLPPPTARRKPARDPHRALHERNPPRRSGPRRRLHGRELRVHLRADREVRTGAVVRERRGDRVQNPGEGRLSRLGSPVRAVHGHGGVRQRGKRGGGEDEGGEYGRRCVAAAAGEGVREAGGAGGF